MPRVTEEFVPADFEDLEKAKNKAIKNIMNVVDLCFDPEEYTSRRRDKMRKVVMDEINELFRTYMMEIENVQYNDSTKS